MYFFLLFFEYLKEDTNFHKEKEKENTSQCHMPC